MTPFSDSDIRQTLPEKTNFGGPVKWSLNWTVKKAIATEGNGRKPCSGFLHFSTRKLGGVRFFLPGNQTETLTAESKMDPFETQLAPDSNA
jgi:hypothetical protein